MASLTKVFFSSPKFPIVMNNNSNFIAPSPLPMIPRCNVVKVHSSNISTPELHHFDYRNGGDDHLLQSNSVIFQDEYQIEHANKLEGFKRLLIEVSQDPLQGLTMIDAIQRLGIDHHFQDEIEQVLQRQYMLCAAGGNGFHNCDLHEVALRFRLLRQEGYFVSAGVFNRFKDREGSFRDEVCRDIKGLMELYEASQLGIDGEDILEEAREFSSRTLKRWEIAEEDLVSGRIIKNTLEQPFHKSLSRFTARNLLRNDHFQGTNGWIYILQDVAKMDFNLVQCLHQKEISHISNWWKQLGLAKELEFARDQPMKWYTWSMACLTDPNLSDQRIDITKTISMIYIIDDIFDVYGSLDELTRFLQVVERWDYAATDVLPDYMKICFKALDDITNEISQKVYKKYGRNPIQSLRKAWITLFKAFLVEAQWFGSGKLPKAKDYLENGIISSGVHIVLVHIFFLLGLGLTDQDVEFIDNNPSIISATATILRLWDDLGSAEDEKQDGHDGSFVNCYMKENQGIEGESVRQQVKDMISNAWKVLNQQCLSRKSFSMTFCKASLNVARMVPLMYSYDENQCLPSLEEYMKSLLYQSVTMKTNFKFHAKF